jgi:hypothetical protein
MDLIHKSTGTMMVLSNKTEVRIIFAVHGDHFTKVRRCPSPWPNALNGLCKRLATSLAVVAMLLNSQPQRLLPERSFANDDVNLPASNRRWLSTLWANFDVAAQFYNLPEISVFISFGGYKF